MSVDGAQFKAALSRWATGVTVVTSRSGGRIHGMTVSDFCGVSLEPPLVLVCADQASNTHALIQEAGVFAVNVLAAEQRSLSDRFASKEDEFRRFEGLDWHPGVTGAPLIRGALASFDCRVMAAHEAGDHVIYVGEVQAIQRGEGQPLVYFGGTYRSLLAKVAKG